MLGDVYTHAFTSLWAGHTALPWAQKPARCALLRPPHATKHNISCTHDNLDITNMNLTTL